MWYVGGERKKKKKSKGNTTGRERERKIGKEDILGVVQYKRK